jgi:hypothetical protein
MNKEDLRRLFMKAQTPNGYTLSDISIRNYISKLNTISKLTTKKDFNNYKFLLQPKKVIEALNKSTLKGVKDYFSPVIILLNLVKADKNIIKKYQDELIKNAEKEYNEREKNILTQTEKERLLSMKEINKRYDEFKIKTPADLMNKLIVAFYFKNDLIPRNNLSKIKITNKDNNLNEDYNYLLVDKDLKPQQIIMMNYKTRNTYGEQRFNITPELKKLLKEYMISFNKEPGDFLFSTESGYEIKDNSFLYVIKNAMNDVLKSPLNIDLIRSILINDFYTGNLKSIQQKKEFARRLLHSPLVSQEYIFVND